MRNCKSFVLGTLCLLCATVTQAASVSYYLDQSNITSLPDGTNYLKVTVADGLSGNINFTVEVLQPLLDIANASGFGIDSFGFNTTGAADAAGSVNITSLPSNWSVITNNNQDGFGKFELIPQTNGAANRLTTLTFTVSGITGDSVYDYLVLSSGNAGQGSQFFAAHVAGFTTSDELTSAYFGGVTPVPVPAAGWLLFSAISGLGILGRKRR